MTIQITGKDEILSLVVKDERGLEACKDLARSAWKLMKNPRYMQISDEDNVLFDYLDRG